LFAQLAQPAWPNSKHARSRRVAPAARIEGRYACRCPLTARGLATLRPGCTRCLLHAPLTEREPAPRLLLNALL
jgi:hypothetical protein